MKRFFAVLYARNLEFLRDKAALSWTVGMPFLLVIGFAMIFSSDDKTLYKVGYLGSQAAINASVMPFVSTQYLRIIPFDNEVTATRKLRFHQIDMVIDEHKPNRYWVNESSPNSYLLERVLWGSGGGDFQRQTVAGEEIRYVDWVLPGILSFNIMMGALFGAGYVIVRYRKSGYLKRLQATPVTAFEFLCAQLVSRLILMQSITVAVFVICHFFINFTMHGSYWLLFLISLLGTVCMISMGLFVAARIASEELAGGLLNLLTWPMMILSGVWFSLEGTHPLIQGFAQILPLTHLVDGARAIMTEGAGFSDIAPNLLMLTGITLVFLLLAAKVFRWD